MRIFQRSQNLFHRRLHFRIRQRPLERAEREAKREADAPVRHALALIPIELAHRDERVRRSRTDSATNRFRGQGLDRRRSRCRARSTDSGAAASPSAAPPDRAAASASRSSSATYTSSFGDRSGRRARWRAPACRRCRSRVRRQRSAAARPRTRYDGTRRAVERQSTCRAPAMRFDDPLHVEEVDRPVSGAPVRRCRHRRSAPTATRRDSPARVMLAPSSNRRTSVRSRCRLCATDAAGRAAATAAAPRIAPTADCRSARSSRSSAKCAASAASMNENVSASEQPAASSTRRTSRSRSMRGSDGGGGRVERGKRRRQPVVAVVARDLLDQIDFAQHVDAECRHRDVPAARRCGESGTRGP